MDNSNQINYDNKILVYTELPTANTSTQFSEQQVPGIQDLLQQVVVQNKILIDQNKQNTNQTKVLIEENNRLREDNLKMYQHFTEEFIALKRTMEHSLKTLEAQNNMFKKLPKFPFENTEDLLAFEKSLVDDDDMALELITKFSKQTKDDVKKFTFENLKGIFGNDSFTSKCSWTSVNENIAVKYFKFITILKDSCINNYSQTNYEKIVDNIKKCFNSAKDRQQKSLKRKATNDS